MPFVNIYYPEHTFNNHQLKEISQSIHTSLVEHFHIPQNDYFHLFHSHQQHQLYYNPHYLLEKGKERTADMVYISITCGAGRTVDQKEKLYQSIAEKLYDCVQLSMCDIFITLIETSLENWSFGEGKAQMLHLGE